ncbi:Type I secretion system membrane fusion protein PrsE [bacterium HR39]|nr:Type I secretion system membrane fusion protein PrsE [bacterium HR39]
MIRRLLRRGRDPRWPDWAVVDPDDLRVARAAHVLLLAILAFFVAFLSWAALADIEEVVRGQGRVVPSRQVQVVQHLEGGIVAEILVREGEIVEPGQVLVRIDDPQAASDYREKRARWLAVVAAIARLKAEIEGGGPVFPPEVVREAPAIVESEEALFRSRREELESQLAILRLQVEQRRTELEALRRRIELEKKSRALLAEELAMNERLARERVVAKADVLRLRRQLNDIDTEIARLELDLPRAESALREAEQRVESALSEFRAKALRELAALESERAGLEPLVAAGEQRVRRTEIRSPVRGIVKKIHVNTIGGVVRPAQELIEIVPLDDTLLVEARLRPQDIAFVHPGQHARVRITAYDYAVYGALDGTVEYISADTVTNEKGESFYVVRVRTKKNHLGSDDDPLEIMPGMTAEVDITTGERTVLAYLLEPMVQVKERAFRER